MYDRQTGSNEKHLQSLRCGAPLDDSARGVLGQATDRADRPRYFLYPAARIGCTAAIHGPPARLLD